MRDHEEEEEEEKDVPKLIPSVSVLSQDSQSNDEEFEKESNDDSNTATNTIMTTSMTRTNQKIIGQRPKRRQVTYVAAPLIAPWTIRAIGATIFGLAYLWPPLILLATYLASFVLPDWFRVNDDSTARRRLVEEFLENDTFTTSFREVPDGVHVEESYWKNRR